SVQDEDSDGKASEGLLIFKVRVHGDKHIELFDGQRQQLAILHSRPAAFRNGDNLYPRREQAFQTARQILIQQHSHGRVPPPLLPRPCPETPQLVPALRWGSLPRRLPAILLPSDDRSMRAPVRASRRTPPRRPINPCPGRQLSCCAAW